MALRHPNANLDDVTSIMVAMRAISGREGAGEIQFPGMVVQYDLNDGRVEINPVSSGGVHNVFGDDIKAYVTWQVSNAISLNAKIYLLEELLELNDPEITHIIRSRHQGGV